MLSLFLFSPKQFTMQHFLSNFSNGRPSQSVLGVSFRSSGHSHEMAVALLVRVQYYPVVVVVKFLSNSPSLSISLNRRQFVKLSSSDSFLTICVCAASDKMPKMLLLFNRSSTALHFFAYFRVNCAWHLNHFFAELFCPASAHNSSRFIFWASALSTPYYSRRQMTSSEATPNFAPSSEVFGFGTQTLIDCRVPHNSN